MTTLGKRTLQTLMITASMMAAGIGCPVYAEEETVEPALEITPVTVRVEATPETTIDKSFTIKNSGSESMKIRIYSAPYTFRAEDETLDFETQTSYTQISRWITFAEGEGDYSSELTLDLNGQEEKSIKYRVDVPDNAASGGQYACLFAEVVPEEIEETGVVTISRAGLTVYGTVPGETHRSMKIKDMGVSPLVLGGKIGVYSNIENTGNIDFQTSIQMIVQSLFGKELYNDTVVSTILPESERRTYAEWGETPGFGLYRLHYTISALGTETDASQLILVMPTLVLVAGIVLITAAGILIVIYLKARKNKSMTDDGSQLTIVGPYQKSPSRK